MAETIRAAVLHSYADLAREVGLDPLRMLDAVGIPRAALDDPDMRISAPALRDLLELSSRNDESFGLRLMERRPVTVAMGPVALIAREQDTLRDALVALQRFNAIHHEATRVAVEEIGDLAIVRIAVRYQSPGPSRQVAEASVSQLMRYLHFFLGTAWRPLSAAFTHAPPSSLEVHHRMFGPSITFNHDFHGVVFHRADLDAQNDAADPEMRRQIERFVEKLERPAEDDSLERVRELIVGLLPTGHCNIGVVARRLALDPRTLQRQLARADTNFSDLLNHARTNLAVQYIDESDRPLVEVADLLGFSALSAFSRWHRDHHGQSPSARRAAALARA